MTKKLEFLYDIVSVPCYLAWTQIPAIAEETRAEVQWTPVFCGGIFKAIGNDGPFGIASKPAWYKGDLMMWAEHLGVPLTMSPDPPFNTLPLMRGALVAEDRGELDTYLAAMFDASFVNVRNINDADQVAAILEKAGLDVGAYFAGIQHDDIKVRLRRNTDDAVTRGVFGVPTFFVGERLFFGQDRLSFVRSAIERL